MSGPNFDFWICQGRLCRAQGADRLGQAVADELAPDEQKRVRILRGGCYGLCELSANVVVRRWESAADLPDTSADRLQLTEQENETVYCQVEMAHIPQLVEAHLKQDAVCVPMTRGVKETATAAPNSTAQKIRALRQAKGPKSP